MAQLAERRSLASELSLSCVELHLTGNQIAILRQITYRVAQNMAQFFGTP